MTQMTPQENRKYLQNLFKLRTFGPNSLAMGDAAATGQIFLESELNKPDPRLRMPLEGHTWFRDLPIQRGGGWVDTETAQFVDLNGPQDNGTGTGSNDIRVLEYNRSQDVYITQPYQVSTRIPLIESLKLAQANKSPQDILEKTVRVDWNKSMDRRVYQGFGNGKYPGLLNQTIVTAQTLPNGTQSTPSPSWTTKLPIDIYNDFNTFAETSYLAGNVGAVEAIPNRVLVPATAFPRLLQPMGTINGNYYAQNILEYTKANYYGKTFGIDLEIFPLPVWAETAGVGNTRRITAYRFDEDCIGFSVLKDLTPYGGPLSLQDGAFVKTYIGNTGQVKVFRPQTVNYWDAA